MTDGRSGVGGSETNHPFRMLDADFAITVPEDGAVF